MRSLLALPVLLAASGCGSSELLQPAGRPVHAGPATATLASAEARVILRLDRFGLRVEDAAGDVLLDSFDGDSTVAGDDVHAYGALGATYHDTTVLPAIIEGWDHVLGTDQPWHHATRVAASSSITGASASLDLFDPADQDTTLHVDVAVEGALVRFDAAVTAQSAAAQGDGAAGVGPLNQVGQSFVLPPGEHFFGLGEKLVTVDHRGRHYEAWVEEGGIAQGEDAPPGPENPSPNGPNMSHLPVPFYLSSRGYGLYLDTTFRTGYALGSDDPGLYRIYAAEPRLRWRAFVHADPRDTIAHYTAVTGRASLPAPWVFGPRRRVDRGSMVNGVPEYQALRTAGVPTTMVDDTTHFLPIGSEVGQEVAIAEYNESVHDQGYKSIAYYNPHVSVTDPATADLVAFGRQQGYFVELDDGTEFDTLVISAGAQRVATIDFTNPDAVIWYGTLLEQALDLGYDGWMLDFGEYLPPHALMADGRTGWEAHNAFPLLYDAAVFDYLTRARGDDFMFFARAGYAGIQAHAPVIWSGDPAASFDDAKGLPAQVRAGINAGLSGVPFWGSDIGGYACNADPPPDKELYLRWAAFGALSSDMHDENACAQQMPGTPPKWTLWSDAETTQVYGSFARLHTRLFPYLYAAAREATLTGLPIIRHPILLHPGEPSAAAVDLEYYFGPALYVAPVVRRGALSRTFWLPPGKWVDWWTLAPAAGGAVVTRDAPIDTIPLYLRSGGIVPMLDPSVETLAPHPSPGVVGLADVAGILDVRAAIDTLTATGRTELVDGTVLDLSLVDGIVSLPAGLPAAADASALATCTRCGLVEALPGGATRVRISVAGANDEAFHAGALALHHHAVGPVLVRWDVVVVP
jgi:alpha-glucosidase (family GH31 glycosyl hydrolase)